MRALAARIRRLVTQYQEAMGLGRWDITVVFGPCPDGVVAQCRPNHRSREAELRFDLSVSIQRSARMVEHDVIHELAHCRLAGYDHLVRLLWDELIEEVAEGAAVDYERMPALTNRPKGATVPHSARRRRAHPVTPGGRMR